MGSEYVCESVSVSVCARVCLCVDGKMFVVYLYNTFLVSEREERNESKCVKKAKLCLVGNDEFVRGDLSENGVCTSRKQVRTRKEGERKITKQ